MKRKVLLDVCCGAGGAAKGYEGHFDEIVGVDINPQPNYPYTFVQADAIEYLKDSAGEYDFFHASFPCQSHSALTKGTNDYYAFKYPDLIPEGRKLLEATNKPFVIENVAGAPIRKDLMLCGEMFGLAVIRHRFFETHHFTVPQLGHLKHRGRVSGYRHGQWFNGPYFAVYGDGGGKGTVAQWQDAMEIYWTDIRKEIAEAIPPAYTRYIAPFLAQGR